MQQHTPTSIGSNRILGTATAARQHLLACADVVVGYVCARHRLSLNGWHIEAALVESRDDFRGGETISLRATPLPGYSVFDIAMPPVGVFREIGSRLTAAFDGINAVVADIQCVAPDVEGSHAIHVDDAITSWLASGA